MKVVDAKEEHLEEFLVGPIRQVDVDEWVLGTGRKVGPTLLMDLGPEALTRALIDERGRCICLWGVHEDGHSGIGNVWLIASPEAERRRRAIHRLWRHEVGLMHDRFATLGAISYHRNELHHHWLRAIGFRCLRVMPIGPFAIPYAVFVRRSEVSPPCVPS